MKLLPMMITQMQRRNTIVALGGMFLLLQVFSFIAHVRGSGRKAEDVLQLEDNPCRPIPFNGRMIPTVPEYMSSFPGSVKGIKRHFVCRPEPTTTPTMTTQNPTSSSSTTRTTTTTPSFTNKESTTVSATGSTTLGSATTTVSPTTQDTTTMSTTMESTTSNPTTVGEPTVKIFVTDEDRNKIFVADLQDQLSFTSIPSSNEPRFITYDSVDKKIYWTDKGEKRVYRADVDGGNRERVTHQGSDDRRGIAIAETSRTLYIANKYPTKITSMSTGEGSTIPGDETEFVDLYGVEPISLEVAEGYLYWTQTGGRIRRRPLDGGGAEDLHTDPSLSELYGLSISPSKGDSLYLFFCDFGEERSFYLEEYDGQLLLIELTSYLQASGYNKAGEKLHDVIYFNGVLYWTKERDPSSIAVMTDYQSARSYEIKETSDIGKPYQLLITTVYQ